MMNIKEYIVKQTKEYHGSGKTDKAVLKRIQYARAYMSGEEALDKLRGRLIDKELGARHDHAAQIAILFNKETAPTEYAQYQSFRSVCKANVDAEMATLRASLLEALNE